MSETWQRGVLFAAAGWNAAALHHAGAMSGAVFAASLLDLVFVALFAAIVLAPQTQPTARPRAA